jgi:hypothetical protein
MRLDAHLHSPNARRDKLILIQSFYDSISAIEAPCYMRPCWTQATNCFIYLYLYRVFTILISVQIVSKLRVNCLGVN